MSNFHIGQEVVTLSNSVTRSSQYRKKGEIVTVTAMKSCPKCPASFVNVNHREHIGPTPQTVCDCGYESVEKKGWSFISEFAPLQTKSEEEDMNEAIEEALSQPAFQ